MFKWLVKLSGCSRILTVPCCWAVSRLLWELQMISYYPPHQNLLKSRLPRQSLLTSRPPRQSPKSGRFPKSGGPRGPWPDFSASSVGYCHLMSKVATHASSAVAMKPDPTWSRPLLHSPGLPLLHGLGLPLLHGPGTPPCHDPDPLPHLFCHWLFLCLPIVLYLSPHILVKYLVLMKFHCYLQQFYNFVLQM